MTLLKGLGFATLVWIAIVVSIPFLPADASGRIAHLKLAPNEFGDFLAGTFAPLAFLWLMAAVFMQSRELKLQREELAATREELTLTRQVAKEQADAAKAQAEEARRSAEQFAVQTEILKDEQRHRHEEEAHEILERELRFLTERFQGNSVILFQNSTKKYKDRFYVSPEAHILDVKENLKKLKSGMYNKFPFVTANSLQGLDALIEKLQSISDLKDRLSEADLRMLKNDEMDERLSLALEIRETLSKFQVID